MMKANQSQEAAIEKQEQAVKKKMRAILQPKDAVYVVYGNWGTKKKYRPA